MPDRYAVFGDPVAHSLSPRIHALFARQFGWQDAMVYGAERVAPARFAACVDRFFAAGGCGLNITVPLKGLAHDLLRARHADGLSAFARATGAVNTLWRDGDGAVCGDNTDGAGLLRDLRDKLGWSVGPTVLLLGAGGAARAALAALRSLAELDTVLVANRSPERAARMVSESMGDGSAASACALADLPAWDGAPFDLVINATSAGMSGRAPALPVSALADAVRCYDLQYGAAAEPFLQAVRQCGVPESRLSDGLGMLIEQAADSFARWRGARPDTAPVRGALRSA